MLCALSFRWVIDGQAIITHPPRNRRAALHSVAALRVHALRLSPSVAVRRRQCRASRTPASASKAVL